MERDGSARIPRRSEGLAITQGLPGYLGDCQIKVLFRGRTAGLSKGPAECAEKVWYGKVGWTRDRNVGRSEAVDSWKRKGDEENQCLLFFKLRYFLQ